MTMQQLSLRRHRFSVDDFHQMAEAGILSDNDRVELIDGEVVEMAAIGPRHLAGVARTNRLLVQRFSDVAIVSPQSSVRLDEHNEPQPDFALLRLRPDYFATELPTPQDIFLIIEIGDSTAQLDRRVKLPLYGTSGVTELWLVDVTADTITVCREPFGQGYRNVRTYRRGDHIAPLAFPDRAVAVTDILGETSPA